MSLRTLEIIKDGDRYFDQSVSLIDTAQSEIFIESYIFEFDPIGLKILKACSMASKRGLKVWLIIDGVGSFTDAEKIIAFCKSHKISLGIYHPIPFASYFVIRFNKNSIVRAFHWLKRMNNRNHRKMVIVDGKKALIGSMNVSRVHSEAEMGTWAWRDSALLIEGTEIQHLRRAFSLAWKKCRRFNYQKRYLTTQFFDYKLSEKIFLNYSFRQRFKMNQKVKKFFKEAERRIFLVTPYFIPKGSILRAMHKASRNGIDVKLLVPEQSDVYLVKWASYATYARLLKKGIKIYEYQKSVLHAKYKIVDDMVWVGSKNMNHRSLVHDLEVEIVETDMDVVNDFILQWEHDLSHAKEISIVEFRKENSWLYRFFSHIFYWFRYWL
jgi:cardiolipin synthase